MALVRTLIGMGCYVALATEIEPEGTADFRAILPLNKAFGSQVVVVPLRGHSAQIPVDKLLENRAC